MELSDFVARTLVDIKKGIETANEGVPKDRHGKGMYYLGSGAGPGAETGVGFDVAVTVSSTESGGAKGGVQIAVFRAELGGEDKQTHEQASRIKFKVFNRHIDE